MDKYKVYKENMKKILAKNQDGEYIIDRQSVSQLLGIRAKNFGKWREDTQSVSLPTRNKMDRLLYERLYFDSDD